MTATQSDFWRGVRDAVPIMIAVAPFGLLFGALAAEIVHMASLLEGEGSPIPDLVADADDGAPQGTVSLAARVRALQAKARRGTGAPPPVGENGKAAETDAVSS